MFIEPQIHSNPEQPIGWIEVVCGSMFSGKTEELIRRVRRSIIAGQDVQIFKPAIDTRYDEVNVVSHNKNKLTSIPLEHSDKLLDSCNDHRVIAVDEAQFFDEGLVEACVELAEKGKRVIISGLDMDFEGKPFGPMPQLMSVAEYITKLHAICMKCGGVASYSFRKINSGEKVLLGETETYEARCRKCFVDGRKKQKEV
ncbi:thymidine kinase [Flammeovirgaceae bacterium SG7u.111]|nr:thymidine kinase [Flammeovirgaceae bacterium SG7u.132]WPO35162.1 thymidine kinase [Flammeovirgaceae bacterium SG7u.111]